MSNVIYPKDAKYCLCCKVPLLGSPEEWDYEIIRGAKICHTCCLRKLFGNRIKLSSDKALHIDEDRR